MRVLAALFLSALLAILGYGVFWLVSLNYTTGQMKGTLEQALEAKVSYGQPQWVPDPLHVTMDMPAVTIELQEGPVRKISAPTMRLSSGFFRRDRWIVDLPPLVEVTLAQGQKLLLETQDGRLMWLRDGNSLTLKANSVRLLDMAGQEKAVLGDLVLERSIFGGSVELNLASRPRWEGGEAVVSGSVRIPSAAFAAMMNLFGYADVPTLSGLMRAAAGQLNPGEKIEVENLSFKHIAQGTTTLGSVFGSIIITREYELVGNLTATSDKVNTILGWVRRAGLIAPRSPSEIAGANRFLRTVGSVRSVRMANMQSTLTLNGQPVGPLPKVKTVVERLW